MDAASRTGSDGGDRDAFAVGTTDLTRYYGETVGVEGLDLAIRSGEIFGFLGPNGAGKTTTIEILEGLKTPDGGEVEVLGHRWADSRREIQERIGVQLQDTVLEEKLTVLEMLRMFHSSSTTEILPLMYYLFLFYRETGCFCQSFLQKFIDRE